MKNIYRKHVTSEYTLYTKIICEDETNTSYSIMFNPASNATSFRVEENYKFETPDGIDDQIVHDMLQGKGKFACKATEWKQAVSRLKQGSREFK